MSNQGRDAFDEPIEKLDAAEARIAELEAERDAAFDDGLRIGQDGLVAHLTGQGTDDKLRAAEAEVVRLTEERDLTQRSHHSEEVKNFHLRAEIAALREALAFYADERNHREQPTPDADRGHYPTHVPVRADGGARARAALAVSQERMCTCKTESTAPGMPHADYCALMQEEK